MSSDASSADPEETTHQVVWIHEHERFDWLTFDPDDIAGRVPCNECGGTGYWGFGPTFEECGPCVVCKGTGLVWVGLG